MLAEQTDGAVAAGQLLLVDDDPNNSILRDIMSGIGQSIGFTVDLAPSLKEAKQLLQTHTYFMVVFDVFFEGQKLTGDRFLLDHKQLLQQARALVITAREFDQIEREPELRKADIPLLKKGTPEFWDEFKQYTGQALAAAKQRRKLANIDLGDELIYKAQVTLLKWLQAIPDRDKKVFAYGAKIYSANTLIEEVQQLTEVGKEHIKMLFELVEFDVER